MTRIVFSLDGREVGAAPGETLWEVARREGTRLPHLCHRPRPGYRPDGNCRACMVEIRGERVLAPSCIRKPETGMEVLSQSERAVAARRMVFALLAADQPDRSSSPDPGSPFWTQADAVGLDLVPLPKRPATKPDGSHPAMRVNLDACIHCNLCVRACREVQVNDVIGMAGRGSRTRVVFDFDDPMGESTCVACGECVQACPTGALMESRFLDGNQVRSSWPDREVKSVCPYCGVGCQITYQIRDDVILAVQGSDGPANQNRLCVKGRFGFDYVRHPDRLHRPLVRREDVPKRADDLVDPADPWTHFREASWEEALDQAARGFARIREQHGPSALAGFGSAKGSNEEAYLFQKLVRTGFGTNNVDHCTRLCHASSVAALSEGIGSAAVTAPFTACMDADVILVIGANPVENHPVAATYFKQAAQRGKTLIVCDPRGQALGRHATHMLQFRPGTDVAMLNALLHVIVEEHLFDTAFVQQRTVGFRQLRDHLQAYSPEAMASECGISADMLRTVARTFATAEASIIFWGMGISQSVHGTDNARCLIDLALITGQVGRPGTGLHPLRGQNNVQGASDAGLIPFAYPDYARVDDPEVRRHFESRWDTDLEAEAGLTVVEILHAARDGTLRGLYVMGENPAMSDPDVRHARTGLARLEHLVVQDLFLTETAFFADVVLPASAWPEKDGTVTNTNRQVQRGRRALPLPGDARPDWWLIQEMARRLGLDWNYSHPRDVFAEMAEVMPSLRNISWERLEAEDSVTYPCAAPGEAGQEIVFGDRFPTGDGKGRLSSVGIVPPDEVPDDEYPMVLSTGRELEHWHTGAMTRRALVLDQLSPAAVASLHPLDTVRLGITPGGRARIETRRGAIELAIREDRAVPEGMIFVPFCYAEAPANALTNPSLDPVGKIPEFKFCAARVTSIERTGG